MPRTIAVNTWVWTSPLTDDTLEPLARTAARMGYDALELPLESVGDWDPLRARTVLDGLGMGAVVVGAMGPGRSLLARAGDVAATQDYLRACLDAAAVLGASIVAGPFYAPTGVTWRMDEAERAEVVGELRSRRPAADAQAQCRLDRDRLPVGVDESVETLVPADAAERAESSVHALRGRVDRVPVPVVAVQDQAVRSPGGQGGGLVDDDAVVGVPVDEAQQPEARGVVVGELQVVHGAHDRDPPRQPVPEDEGGRERELAGGLPPRRAVELRLGPVPVEGVVAPEEGRLPREPEVVEALRRPQRLVEHLVVRIRRRTRGAQGLHHADARGGFGHRGVLRWATVFVVAVAERGGDGAAAAVDQAGAAGVVGDVPGDGAEGPAHAADGDPGDASEEGARPEQASAQPSGSELQRDAGARVGGAERPLRRPGPAEPCGDDEVLGLRLVAPDDARAVCDQLAGEQGVLAAAEAQRRVEPHAGFAHGAQVEQEVPRSGHRQRGPSGPGRAAEGAGREQPRVDIVVEHRDHPTHDGIRVGGAPRRDERRQPAGTRHLVVIDEGEQVPVGGLVQKPIARGDDARRRLDDVAHGECGARGHLPRGAGGVVVDDQHLDVHTQLRALRDPLRERAQQRRQQLRPPVGGYADRHGDRVARLRSPRHPPHPHGSPCACVPAPAHRTVNAGCAEPALAYSRCPGSRRRSRLWGIRPAPRSGP